MTPSVVPSSWLAQKARPSAPESRARTSRPSGPSMCACSHTQRDDKVIHMVGSVIHLLGCLSASLTCAICDAQCTSFDHRSIVKDVSVINKINNSSDHRPVRAKIKFNFKIHRLKHFQSKITKHSKHTLVKNSDQFNLELTNQFSSLSINDIEDVDEQYKAIVKGIENSSKTIKVSRKNKTKLSTQTKSLIAKSQLLAKSQLSDLEIYTTEFRSVDRAWSAQQRTACSATALAVGSDSASALTDPRKAWKEARAPRADRPPGHITRVDATERPPAS
ncbi:Endonuclease-reverse transcriptase, partial [Operophtera brumata]